ncbi:MAG: hypothetical protein EOO71_00845 [Myxococcaceae bacterium]|nr:MAG: hypothetical protein EOO71_00845 [Myxococcaceae bacterium]
MKVFRIPMQWTAALLAMLTQLPGTAEAFSYSASYMNNWGGCACSNSSLSYTGDQMDMFDAALASRGHNRMHKFANASVWASDYIEDTLGGQDNFFSDDSDIIAYSGHGSAPNYSAGQAFTASVCSAGTSSSCTFSSHDFRLGEQGGSYAYPYAGSTRWALWFTCYSVHTQPDQQWGPALWQGLEYVMGYRDTSLDSETTDEVPEDWVEKAIGDSDTFKSAWFWAVEDWWANDTGELVSTGPESETAAYRRDNLNKNWARRAPYDYGYWIAWSWHEG